MNVNVLLHIILDFAWVSIVYGWGHSRGRNFERDKILQITLKK